jgi:two-component sensor histidine kinase
VFTNFTASSYYIQSVESRSKAINRFCWSIVFQGILFSILFAFFKLYYISLFLLFIGGSFRYFAFLNKRSHQEIAKTAIIITTNVGVVIFSAILGFNSGVYLYFFVSPMLVYLIFDFTQKKSIYLSLIFYLFGFLLASFFHHYKTFEPIKLSGSILEIIYNINFVFAFLLCFSLVIYFSGSNQTYINKLRQSNKEKDILLSEIHHRVKNNLAVISGLMELQGTYLKDNVALNILKDSTRRIKAIGLLHEKLYNGDDYEKIRLDVYINDLVEYFKIIFPEQAEKINLDLLIEPIELAVAEALPLSLILNELLTNSFKYAFKENVRGEITLILKQENNAIKVTVKDNGCGFVINDGLKEISLGLNLVYSLSEQLGGKTELSSDKNGTVYQMEFVPVEI